MRIILSMVLSAFIGCGVLSAQTPQAEPQQTIDYEKIIQQRVDRVQKSLVLDDQTAAKFAPLYKEYLQSMGKCFANCPYRNTTTDLTDAEKEKRIEYQFECRQNMLNTQKEYYPKFKKILNASQLEKIFANGRFNFGQRNNFGRRGGYNNNRGTRRGLNYPYCDGTRQHRHYSGYCPYN